MDDGEVLTASTFSAPLVRRLSILMSDPQRYVERRTETVRFAGDTAIGVDCRIQVVHPSMDPVEDQAVVQRENTKAEGVSGSENEGVASDIDCERETWVIFPLGVFRRTRVPELRVRAADGRELPTLSRNERAKVLAAVITGNFLGRHLEILRRLGPKSVDYGEYLYENIRTSILGVLVAEDRAKGLQALAALYETLNGQLRGQQLPSKACRLALLSIVTDEAFWSGLEALCGTTIVLAVGRATPSLPSVLTYAYQEEIDDSSTIGHRGMLAGESPRRTVFSKRELALRDFLIARQDPVAASTCSKKRLRRISLFWHLCTSVGRALAWLGLTSTQITRENPNADHCRRYYLTLDVGDALEVNRFYWGWQEDQDTDLEAVRRQDSRSPTLSIGYAQCASIVPDSVGSGERQHVRREMLRAIGDVQVMATGRTRLAVALSALVGIVSALVVLNGSRYASGDAALLAFLQLVTALPPVLVGSLVVRGDDFASRLYRGPRFLAMVMACLGVLAAVQVGLNGSYNRFSLVLSLGSLFVSTFLVLVFLHSSLGPRFRTNRRTRYLTPRLLGLAAKLRRHVTVESLPKASAASRRYDQARYGAIFACGAVVASIGTTWFVYLWRSPTAIRTTPTANAGIIASPNIPWSWLIVALVWTVGFLVLIALTVVVFPAYNEARKLEGDIKHEYTSENRPPWRR